MRKRVTIIALCLVCILIIGLVGLGLLFSKFYQHEKWQNEQIHDLTDKIEKLANKVEYADNAYNYLAIGNSITRHGLADYWWDEVGMAATKADNDYVHLVVDYLKDTYGDVCYYAINFCTWENQEHDRAETHYILDTYLSTKLDLVTIQLSENVSDITTFKTDFEALINYIHDNAPNADIYIIGDFWDSGEKELMKIEAATDIGVPFISLDKIKGNPEYQCGIGTIVYDAKGNEHVVEHNGVASHPSDKGMKYIADAIIERLKTFE